MKVKTLEALAKSGALRGRRVLIRSDLNAPHDAEGRITNETRLVASVPAIRMALDAAVRRKVSSRPKIRSPASPAAWVNFSAAKCRSSPTGSTASRSNPATS